LLIDIKDKNKKWYLLYTKPRFEKKVDVELQLLGFETYLPLNRTLKQWSDRKKWVTEPLFKSYLFINTSISYYYDILNVNGIVKFVNFEKSPVVVSGKEISLIKQILGSEIAIEVMNEDFIVGTNIEIISGPMHGVKGFIIENRSNSQVVVSLQSIKQNILLNIPVNKIRNCLNK
jgi:transcription antitermination factor NusG